MTVLELSQQLSLTPLTQGRDLSEPVTGCYVGDLLSWVMSHAQPGSVWITVMGNLNSIAVASLTDCSCVVLADSATLDEDAKAKAQQLGMSVFQSNKSAYDLAAHIARLLS